jgi:UDP-N-acetylmuramoyl-L-alanyl-D-glutamate--2,6-diaminopimelate ligase
MTLLLDEIHLLETVGDPADVDVRGIEHDSRRVRPGDMFCCLPGHGTDGHRYAADAVGRGAVGLLCEHVVEGLPVVQARVAPGQARPAMARLAAAFWGFPSRDLLMAGITGTNGKTSVAHLLGAALGASGRPATVLGTLSGARTTPEATELQRTLAAVRDGAAPGEHAAVAMEVSSHALAQSRVDGIHFDVAVFTNLSHDHLDFHQTMGEYFAAKALLFTPERAVRGIVNAEDRWGRRLLAQARVPMVAVRADMATQVKLAIGRSSFTWRGQRVALAMTGAVNVQNAVIAAEAAVALGLDPVDVARGLADAGTVPGRLEVVVGPGRDGPGTARPPFAVLVDYAHTPAGLEVVLAEARRLAAGGRVLVVFGCGGDRDRAKRPLMGEVATRLADRAYLTSDNPRHEDPAAIIDEVRAGVVSPEAAVAAGRLVVDADRRAAIVAALADARPRDIVVVAGKGHEAVQEVGDERRPFDDRQVVADAVADRWPRTRVG